MARSDELASQKPEVANQAMALLVDWQQTMALTCRSGIDPMLTVLKEGGPYHTRGELAGYLETLRVNGRSITLTPY